jgi:hypothetical protein
MADGKSHSAYSASEKPAGGDGKRHPNYNYDEAVLKVFEMYVLTSVFVEFIKLNIFHKPISSIGPVEASLKESPSKFAAPTQS